MFLKRFFNRPGECLSPLIEAHSTPCEEYQPLHISPQMVLSNGYGDGFTPVFIRHYILATIPTQNNASAKVAVIFGILVSFTQLCLWKSPK